MLTGTVPFESPHYAEIMALQKSQKPESMRKRRPDLDIPEEVDNLVLKTLEKNPDDRFSDMEEMIDAIEACGIEPDELRILPETKIEKAEKPNRLVKWIVDKISFSSFIIGYLISDPVKWMDFPLIHFKKSY